MEKRPQCFIVMCLIKNLRSSRTKSKRRVASTSDPMQSCGEVSTTSTHVRTAEMLKPKIRLGFCLSRSHGKRLRNRVGGRDPYTRHCTDQDKQKTRWRAKEVLQHIAKIKEILRPAHRRDHQIHYRRQGKKGDEDGGTREVAQDDR